MTKFKDFTRCVTWDRSLIIDDIFNQLWLGNKVVVNSPTEDHYMLLYYNGCGRYQLIVDGEVVMSDSSDVWPTHIFSEYAPAFESGLFNSTPSMFSLRIKGVFVN